MAEFWQPHKKQGKRTPDQILNRVAAAVHFSI